MKALRISQVGMSRARISRVGISRVLAAAAIVVGGAVLIAAPASAQVYGGEGPPIASISSSTVTAGQDVTVVGSNFNPGEVATGTVFSTPRPIGTQTANASGQVSFTFSTAGLEAGQHTVLLEGNQGHTASLHFSVVAPGQNSGIPGSNGNSGTSGNSGTNGSSGTNGGNGVGSGSGGSGTVSGSTGVGAGSSGSNNTASSIDTGNPGGDSGPNAALIGGGIVLVAVAGAGGVIVIRRRNAA